MIYPTHKSYRKVVKHHKICTCDSGALLQIIGDGKISLETRDYGLRPREQASSSPLTSQWLEQWYYFPSSIS